MQKTIDIQNKIRSLRSPIKAQILLRFFKTGKGEYGEGDKFLGVVVPSLRKIAKEHKDVNFVELSELIKSEWHEERMTALLILVYKFKQANPVEQKKIYDFYLANTKYINNWDLVDVTCKDIVGGYLFTKDKRKLYQLVKSKNIWERRIAMISCFYFIMKGEFADALLVSELLLNDRHDLIHKAVGWMLREVGKRCSESILEAFLHKHYKKMPRVMLRYAIEKLPEAKRIKYLKGQIG